MTFYWSYKALPELAGLPDDEKRRVWGRAYRRAVRLPSFWAGWAAFVGIVTVVTAFGRLAFGPRFEAAAVFLSTAVTGTFFGQAAIALARPFVPRELPGRCRGCGRDLAAAAACPACGAGPATGAAG